MKKISGIRQRVRNEMIGFLHPRVLEHLYRILDKDIPWEDKESYYVKIQEDRLVLEKLLGTPVEIKIELVW